MAPLTRHQVRWQATTRCPKSLRAGHFILSNRISSAVRLAHRYAARPLSAVAIWEAMHTASRPAGLPGRGAVTGVEWKLDPGAFQRVHTLFKAVMHRGMRISEALSTCTYEPGWWSESAPSRGRMGGDQRRFFPQLQISARVVRRRGRWPYGKEARMTHAAPDPQPRPEYHIPS